MEKISRTIKVYGYETKEGYRETWNRPATKKELEEWEGKLVYQDTRKLAMELEDFVMNAKEVHDEN